MYSPFTLINWLKRFSHGAKQLWYSSLSALIFFSPSQWGKIISLSSPFSFGETKGNHKVRDLVGWVGEKAVSSIFFNHKLRSRQAVTRAAFWSRVNKRGMNFAAIRLTCESSAIIRCNELKYRPDFSASSSILCLLYTRERVFFCIFISSGHGRPARALNVSDWQIATFELR